MKYWYSNMINFNILMAKQKVKICKWLRFQSKENQFKKCYHMYQISVFSNYLRFENWRKT